MLSDARRPETVREWVRAEPDPGRRAVAFACAMAEHYRDLFAVEEDPRQPESALHNEQMRLALARVNWRRVAEALLRHFTLPMLLASPAAKPRAGRVAGPAAWRGPVN